MTIDPYDLRFNKEKYFEKIKETELKRKRI